MLKSLSSVSTPHSRLCINYSMCNFAWRQLEDIYILYLNSSRPLGQNCMAVLKRNFKYINLLTDKNMEENKKIFNLHLIRKATTGTKPSLSRLVKAQLPPPTFHPLTKSEVQSLLVALSPTATSELRTHDIVRMPTPTFGGLHPTDYLMFHIWEKIFSISTNPLYY